MDVIGVKLTTRDQPVLDLLVQGCSNQEIAGPSVRPRTVKQHLRTLSLRAGIRNRRQRVKPGNRGFRQPGSDSMMPRLTAKEIQIADFGLARAYQP
jgi:DNA-binding CsgD family transcriptional regulator